MSPPRFYEATVLLPAGAEPRWRAREISYDDMTVTVAEGIARLFTLESGTSLDGFTVERDGDTLLFRLLVDTKIPWERILEAMLHAAVLEGGLAEMIGGDRWAEPGDVSTHAFDGNGRCEGVVVDDIDAWVARCDTFRAIIAQQQRRMLPWIDKHANLTIDAAVAIAFEYPCGPERDRALAVLGDATDPAGVATLLRAFDQQDLPPWPLAAYGGKAAARQRDDELRQLRADAGRVLAKTTDRTPPRALLAILDRGWLEHGYRSLRRCHPVARRSEDRGFRGRLDRVVAQPSVGHDPPRGRARTLRVGNAAQPRHARQTTMGRRQRSRVCARIRTSRSRDRIRSCCAVLSARDARLRRHIRASVGHRRRRFWRNRSSSPRTRGPEVDPAVDVSRGSSAARLARNVPARPVA